MSSFSSESNVNQAHDYPKKEGTQMEQRVHKLFRKEFVLTNHSNGCSVVVMVVKEKISKYRNHANTEEKDSTIQRVINFLVDENSWWNNQTKLHIARDEPCPR